MFKRKTCKQCGWELGFLSRQSFCSEQCAAIWNKDKREREQYELSKKK